MIVKSSIIENTVQADKQRHVTEEHIDHLSNKHYQFYAAENGADIEKIMSNRVNHINNMLVENEIKKAVKIIENGQQMPDLEFATEEQVKLAFIDKRDVYDQEISVLTSKKTNLNSEITEVK